MIVEFEPTKILTSYPPLWCLSYKQENEINFKRIFVTYEQIKLFLETYGYETNHIFELKAFGIDTTNIKHNKKL